MNTVRWLVVSCFIVVAGFARSVLAATSWINVSPSEVITNLWSNDANWSDGKPGVELAYLTNQVNSYVVNYNTTDTGYDGGYLYISQAAPYYTTLNINATMGSSANRCRIHTLGSRSIVNVNNGGTWNVRLGDQTAYSVYGYLNVNNGGTVNMSYQNKNQYKRMKIVIESGGLFDGEYAITPGGSIRVEQGGVYTGRSLQMGDRWLPGTASVTNRGSFATTRSTTVASGMQHSDRDAFFSMEDGTAMFGSEGGDYGLSISEYPAWSATVGWAGRGEFAMSGGVVTNNVLQIGYSVRVGDATEAHSAIGFLTLEGGTFWNLGHALIGGFPTTIDAGSVDNAANDLRGTVNQSGGALRSFGHAYVANGPSTGTLNLSGGTFTVANSGAAKLYLGANEGANVHLIGKGTINLTGGHLTTDQLLATNGTLNSVINFSSGTMELLESATVGAGTDLTVGDGVATARLILGEDALVLDEEAAPEAVVRLNSSSRIDIAEDAVLQQNFGAMTLEFWFRPTRIDDWHVIIHRSDVGGTSVGGSAWYAGIDPAGYLCVTFNARHADSAWDDGKTGFKPVLDTWYHVAGVWDGNQGHVYVDGTLIHSYDSNPMIDNGPGAMRFGNQVGGNRPYYGLLSDVRLWDQARTEQQINDSRLSRLTGSEAGLIGYWPLNEGSGTTAGDLSTSGIDGTLSLSSAWKSQLPAFTFADGATINTNAVLDIGGTNEIGMVAVTGDVTLREDARLAWDFRATTQDSLTVDGTVALPASATVELTSLDGSTPASIPLLTVTGGFTGSPAGWPRISLNGVSYGALIEGDTLLMAQPRGTLITIY